MEQTLTEFLENNRAKGFRKIPHYYPNGDFVTFYFQNDRCYAERVDDRLTVYLSLDTKELVGCKIKGIRKTLQTAGDFGVDLDLGKIRLNFLFFAGALSHEKNSCQRHRYDELCEKSLEAELDLKELELAS